MKKLYLPAFLFEVQVNGVTGEWSHLLSEIVKAAKKSQSNQSEVKIYRIHKGTGIKELYAHSTRGKAFDWFNKKYQIICVNQGLI